jgi:hypothetical protein
MIYTDKAKQTGAWIVLVAADEKRLKYPPVN